MVLGSSYINVVECITGNCAESLKNVGGGIRCYNNVNEIIDIALRVL